MKALLVTHDFLPGLPGGISTYYHRLGCELGDAIAVLAPGLNGESEFDSAQPFSIHRRKIPVTPTSWMRRDRFPGLRWPRAALLAAVQWVLFYRHARRLLRREEAGVLLIGHLYLAPVGIALRRVTGVPFGVMLHGSELHRYIGRRLVRAILLRCLNGADFLVVNSDFTRRQYLELGVRPEQRFLKVNPGVDSSLFRPDAGDPERLRRDLRLGDRPVLLSVARLVPWKGHDRVLRALPRILERVPDAVYLIVGEGPHRSALEEIVAEQGLEDHVHFAGFVPDEDLPSYYRVADVVVVPTREVAEGMAIEGFGIVFVEAGACGVPVIGGRMGGTDESIEEGVTGFRVDPDDPRMLTDAIVRMLADRDLARRFGRAGRDRAVQLFDWSRQAERLRGFLEQVADDD